MLSSGGEGVQSWEIKFRNCNYLHHHHTQLSSMVQSQVHLSWFPRPCQFAERWLCPLC